jgi:hypothetical protein
MMHGPG